HEHFVSGGLGRGKRGFWGGPRGQARPTRRANGAILNPILGCALTSAISVVRPKRAGSGGPNTRRSAKKPLIAYSAWEAPEPEMPPSAVRDRFRAEPGRGRAAPRLDRSRRQMAGGRVAHSAKN